MKRLPMAFSAVNGDVYCEIVSPPVGADSPAKYKRRGVPLAFLTSVYTAPRLRNKKLAGMLLQVAFAYARATSIDLCTYACSHGRAATVSDWDLMFWYQRMGFVCVKPAYNDPQEWLIWRHEWKPLSESLKKISKTRPVPEPSKNSVYSV